MTHYTAAEVQEAANRAGDFEWGYEASMTLRGESVPIDWVASTGGMDEGSNASEVFKIGDQLFMKSGYYASHYGYDWDGDLNEVEPYKRVVNDYRPI